METDRIICPFCRNQMGVLARYCNQCGTKLPPPSKPVDYKQQAELKRGCPKNHTMLEAMGLSGFCSQCGAKIGRPIN